MLNIRDVLPPGGRDWHTALFPYLERLQYWDRAWCVRFNRSSHHTAVCRACRLISRLGDGVFWYALMIALLCAFHWHAMHAVLHMIATGGTCVVIYKWLKDKTLRPRPYEVDEKIHCAMPPLDKFSFPSGHTLHAVAFSVVAVAYYPGLIWLVLPFSALLALSRIVLGLHYPSDVVAGASVGALLSLISLRIF